MQALRSLSSTLGLAEPLDLLSNATLATTAAAIIPLHVVPGEGSGGHLYCNPICE